MHEYFMGGGFSFFVYTYKNNRLQLIWIFSRHRLTLSPVTGRRPDYTIFSADIGVTDVT